MTSGSPRYRAPTVPSHSSECAPTTDSAMETMIMDFNCDVSLMRRGRLVRERYETARVFVLRLRS